MVTRVAEEASEALALGVQEHGPVRPTSGIAVPGSLVEKRTRVNVRPARGRFRAADIVDQFEPPGSQPWSRRR
jgi:hypothetical protein